eukprot:gene13177-27867_t
MMIRLVKVLLLSSVALITESKHLQIPDKLSVTTSKFSESDHFASITAQKDEKFVINGPLCMIGGSLLHMAFGTMYCWGNFMSYAPPHLQFLDGKDHTGKQPDALLVLPIIVVSQCLAMPFGPVLVKNIGAFYGALLGGWTVALGVFLSSFAKTLPLFILAYSVMFGVGTGLGYTAPMIAGWKWLPNSKGLVSGTVLMGFGLGGFIFNLIGTKFANPNGLDIKNGRFPQEVYDNFPKMLRQLAILYAGVVLLGSSFITEPKSQPVTTTPIPSLQTKNIKHKPQVSPAIASVDLSVEQAVKTPQFWLVWTMLILSASSVLNVAAVYKRFATSAAALQGDQFQATVGGLGAAFNGGGRLLWGALSDKIGFKKSFILLTLSQVITQILYPYSSSSKTAFMAVTCLSFFALAGNFALAPPAIQRLYGATNGAKIYGYLFSAFGVASVGGLMISK